jgi:hypothetical protein
MFGRVATMVMAVALFAAAAPAQAERLAFTADLAGDKPPTATGSKAVGHAQILVDTDAQTVDMVLDVKGMKVDELWAQLVKAPIGPVHLHRYGTHEHPDPNSSELAFPFPYGASYQPTAAGFRVEAKGYRYDLSAASVNSKVSFEEFVASMQRGDVVLNIHSNANKDGEISGVVAPAKG